MTQQILMTAQQRADTLAIARRVLDEDNPNRFRKAWARDVVAALEGNDMAAARRASMTVADVPEAAEVRV